MEEPSFLVPVHRIIGRVEIQDNLVRSPRVRLQKQQTKYLDATCGTLRLTFLKIGARVNISVRRIKIAMTSGCPVASVWGDAATRLNAAASARGSPA